MPLPLLKKSGCKVNLLLNVLGRRPDGFHELETLLQPVPLFDELSFRTAPSGIVLTCGDPRLPADPGNLVHRAAAAWLAAAGVRDGVRIHLEKRVPLAAGLGGGSANAATTLLGLNELFGQPLDGDRLARLAADLGSDVPFFLQHQPALAFGRGERVRALPPFDALRGRGLLLIHPGFGIATPWAYQQLAQFPEALCGRPGRAARLVERLQAGDLTAAAPEFYNALEAPAFRKFPILALYQEWLRAQGALAALMSGSGSTTFALTESQDTALALEHGFRRRFGDSLWTAVVALA